VVPLIPADMTMRGATFQPNIWIPFIKSRYIASFCIYFVFRILIIGIDKFDKLNNKKGVYIGAWFT
jgi:hypothetical protein